jgi:hypothetical protein
VMMMMMTYYNIKIVFQQFYFTSVNQCCCSFLVLFELSFF